MAVDISSITFGVEIQCIVERILSKDEKNYVSDKTIEDRVYMLDLGFHNLVKKLLDGAGIPTYMTIDEINSHDATRYHKWFVDYDKTIEIRHDTILPRYKYPVALISPLYNIGNFFSAFIAIWDVLHVLTTNNSKLWVNTSTALHVHIGNGDQGFEFEPALAIAQLVTGFESQIGKAIHPRYLARAQSGAYCLPPSKLSSFCDASGPRERVALLRAKAHDIPSLVGLMNPPRQEEHEEQRQDGPSTETLPSNNSARSSAYNFLGLDPSVRIENVDPKPTVEFRQHHGTTEPSEILNWVRLLLQIVFFAHTADQETLDAVLGKADGSLVDFMRAIGCSEAHVEYYSTKTWPDSNEERPELDAIAEEEEQEVLGEDLDVV
ncbi:hypothetical protein MMC11_001846 [Xylographa trunciseda]|nr:hypothetical protein [Xylographa trunciseda]